MFNSSHVDVAALAADQMCGEGTRLIYYISPGQLVTRTFTPKDTHSLSGKLIVIYSGVSIFCVPVGGSLLVDLPNVIMYRPQLVREIIRGHPVVIDIREGLLDRRRSDQKTNPSEFHPKSSD